MRILYLLSTCLFYQVLVSCNQGLSQNANYSFTFSQIPISEPDLNRPGAGTEQWNGQNTVNIPNVSLNTQRLDAYYRFSYTDIAPYDSNPNTYNFTIFDSRINDAISKGQKFSFCIMQMCGVCSQGAQVGGAKLYYPLYLHTQMQSEIVRDWIKDGVWIPNYNSPNWLTSWKALNAAVYKHIMTGSFLDIRYKDVINYIDVSGYGDYGEWTNNAFSGPAAAVATVTTLDSIISYTVHQYTDFQCVALISTFDGNQLNNTMIPPAVGFYALTTRNRTGLLGLRRDNWGWTDNYISRWMHVNPTVYNGFHFDTAINSRYKYAPVVGEPADLGYADYGGQPFGDLPRQMQFYHVNSFGNGNIDKSLNNAAALDNIRTASKYAGYRLVLTDGNMTPALIAGGRFSITINWQNLGAAPTYEQWNVLFELKNISNKIVWTGMSKFSPRLFLPSRIPTSKTDNFTLPASVPLGMYSMYLT
ncbi:MAG TPA: DUF4832 domain-containing protein, partial [Puia sp.]